VKWFEACLCSDVGKVGVELGFGRQRLVFLLGGSVQIANH
jgi:hypothetical protein